MSDGRGAEGGFVLLAAIWFIALLAVIAVIIAGWMTRSFDLAAQLQHRLSAQAATISAKNEIAYRVVSGFFSTRGLELPAGNDRLQAVNQLAISGYRFSTESPYLRLDNRPYRFGSTIIRLQDDRGLLSLNHPDPARLGRLLRRYGVDYNDGGMLFDRLQDYMENSPLHRLRGATDDDYQKAGMPPPRGARLLTPWELLRVISWPDYRAFWQNSQALTDLTTSGDVVQLNPNTAPEAILAALLGMNDETAQRVVAYRQKYMMESQVDLDRAANAVVAVDPMSLMFFPSASLEATITPQDDPITHRLRVSLTPNGKAPYRIDYFVDLPASSRTLLTAPDAQLPAISVAY